MAEREQWCTDKLSQLFIQDQNITNLSDLKDHLMKIPQEELYRYATTQLPKVFNWIITDSLTRDLP